MRLRSHVEIRIVLIDVISGGFPHVDANKISCGPTANARVAADNSTTKPCLKKQ